MYKTLFCVVAGLCLAGGAYGGYLTIVDLPATGTDAAIGIDPNKTYTHTHTLDFGSNAPATVNGVAFDQGPTAEMVAPFVGVSRQGYAYIISDTRDFVNIKPHAGNDPAAVADGNSVELLRDMIYYSGGEQAGQGIIVTLQDLVAGVKYAIRYCFRQWDTGTPRPLTVSVDGGGSIAIDIDGPGAHVLDCTFVADGNDVSMTFITGITGEGPHIYGLTKYGSA